jgi:hypothetical protein
VRKSDLEVLWVLDFYSKGFAVAMSIYKDLKQKMLRISE